MDLKLDRKGQLPIHAQLKAQLVYLIQSGQLPVGSQLPTVRQMAGFLRVNRNTVSKVFSEMEKEGYVSCESGRGTFVSAKKKDYQMGLRRMDKLLAIIDDSLDRARQLGFNPDEFSLTLYARIQTGAGTPRVHKPSALFIECNRPQAESFGQELERQLPLRVDPMLLDDFMREAEQSKESLNRYDLIVTTFYHVHEVQMLLAGTEIEVIGLMVNTGLKALMRLTSLPKDTKVGVACVNRAGSENCKLSIQRAGLNHLNLITAYGDDRESLRKMAKEVNVIVCSSFVEKEIRAVSPSDKEIIVDERGLDPGGIEMLRHRLRWISSRSEDLVVSEPVSA